MKLLDTAGGESTDSRNGDIVSRMIHGLAAAYFSCIATKTVPQRLGGTWHFATIFAAALLWRESMKPRNSGAKPYTRTAAMHTMTARTLGLDGSKEKRLNFLDDRWPKFSLCTRSRDRSWLYRDIPARLAASPLAPQQRVLDRRCPVSGRFAKRGRALNREFQSPLCRGDRRSKSYSSGHVPDSCSLDTDEARLTFVRRAQEWSISPRAPHGAGPLEQADAWNRASEAKISCRR